MSAPDTAVEVRPANEASWTDLETIFGDRGAGSRCYCQRYKLAPGEAFGSFPREERAHRLRAQTDSDHPEADRTSGLVGYLDGQPVGWCAVEPRPRFTGLVRVFRVPWAGRSEEDRTDEGVWSVPCVFTRARYRRRGVSRALVAAAVDHARRQSARAIEGYPITSTNAIEEELHVGTVGTFAAAGFLEVARPTVRRVVMRIDF